MSGSSIPTFGSANSVYSDASASNPMLANTTVVAMMYNYYDPALIGNNDNEVVTSSANKMVLNPFGYQPITELSGNQVLVTGLNIAYNSDGFLTQKQFTDLFYPAASGYFNVNSNNVSNPAIRLNSQTYTSSNSQTNRFTLAQAMLHAFTTNKGIHVNDIDPRVVLLLEKECHVVQSLAQVKGQCVSLSWDQVINTLITTGYVTRISSGDDLDTPDLASVPLAVILNFHSFVLNTDMTIKFTYNVLIRGFTLATNVMTV